MREVTERELDSIRDAQGDFQPGLFVIRRSRYVGDDRYESETVATDVPGRLIPGFGRWSVVADRYQGIVAYRFTVPYDQELLAGDVIVDQEGQPYQVREVFSSSSYQTATQALVDKVRDKRDG